VQAGVAHVPREIDANVRHVLTARLLLASARAALDDRARDELAAVVAQASDWDVVIARSVAEGTAGLLAAHVRALDPELVPAPVRARLGAIHAAIWARNAVLVDRWTDLTARFDAAGIPCLTLKGMALVHRLYADLGLRPMTDIDVLVPREDHEAAGRVASDAGYEIRSDGAGDTLQGYTLFARGDVFLDLHWHLARYSRFDGIVDVDHAAVWQRARPLPGARAGRRTLAPEDMLLHLALHLTLGSEFGRLVWLTDIDALLRAHGSLDWEHVLSEASRWRIRAVLGYTLAVAHASLGSPVPPEARQQRRLRRALLSVCVDAPRPASLRRELHAFRLFLGEAFLMDRARDVVRVVWGSVFPSGAWLRLHYRLRARWEVGVYRVLHPLRVCYLAVTRSR
jgi:hypothetical protein